MHRFFTTQPLSSTIIIQDAGIVQQITRVFRAKKGDLFCFFGSQTDNYIYEIAEISGRSVGCILREVQENAIKIKSSITLFQAYPHKMDTLELIVQKIVEIGVEELVLFRSNRSQMSELSDNKKLRLQKIAIEALEQCGGNRPLKIVYDPGSLNDIYDNRSELFHIVGDPLGKREIASEKLEKVGLWIGPEGGWSPEELSIFEAKNIYRWKFSDQVLRLETAAILGSGLLSYFASKE